MKIVQYINRRSISSDESSLIEKFKHFELDLKELSSEEIDLLLIYCTIFMEIKLIYQLFECKEKYPEFHLNINTQDQDGNTALHYVSISESEAWQFVNSLASFYLRQPEINPNIQNKIGCTPFLFSCYQSFDDISIILLNHGVDVNIPNHSNETPLMICFSMRKHDLIELLIERHADVNVQDTICGDTALTLAGKFGYGTDILELLIKKGHANINVANFEEETPLILYCLINNIECSKLLVEYGADINVQEKTKGLTPLMIALENFNYNIARYLCEHNADLEIVNHNGDTVLLQTCSIYNKYGTELLLHYSADVTVKNREGLTPKELIEKNNFNFIIGL